MPDAAISAGLTRSQFQIASVLLFFHLSSLMPESGVHNRPTLRGFCAGLGGDVGAGAGFFVVDVGFGAGFLVVDVGFGAGFFVVVGFGAGFLLVVVGFGAGFLVVEVGLGAGFFVDVGFATGFLVVDGGLGLGFVDVGLGLGLGVDVAFTGFFVVLGLAVGVGLLVAFFVVGAAFTTNVGWIPRCALALAAAARAEIACLWRRLRAVVASTVQTAKSKKKSVRAARRAMVTRRNDEEKKDGKRELRQPVFEFEHVRDEGRGWRPCVRVGGAG